MTELPEDLLRTDNGLPEVSQIDVARHYLRLSQRNYGVDSGFYPLGSCTMKYNPKVNESLARLPAFAQLHPLVPASAAQGGLALIFGLQECLKEIGGFAAVSLQPSAGAHGELTGLLMMRAYHADRKEYDRTQVLIPDSAHGTNPASTTMAGLNVVELPTDPRGNIDLDALRAACGPSVAGLMLTNPNTLGLLEEQVEQVVRIVHECGGLVYG
ncbi:MAG: aminomethyl-transferring glycine dehydrogenase subunit GcvPB, partial [Rhizobiales bacterium]|nr:aminomethyl-transferring glycine dehydrogenase subunit GcvPB [Hyphomicrobiales bacterium]